VDGCGGIAEVNCDCVGGSSHECWRVELTVFAYVCFASGEVMVLTGMLSNMGACARRCAGGMGTVVGSDVNGCPMSLSGVLMLKGTSSQSPRLAPLLGASVFEDWLVLAAKAESCSEGGIFECQEGSHGCRVGEGGDNFDLYLDLEEDKGIVMYIGVVVRR
jgi:hypothetical protein